jgi:hypothetical protein
VGVPERCTRRLEREIGGYFALRRDMALANPGALHDPFVGRLDTGGQFLIGKDATGQIAAAAKHDRTQHGHEAALPIAAALTRACR